MMSSPRVSRGVSFSACRYLGLLGSSIGNDAYHIIYFGFDTNHIADIGNTGRFKCHLHSK